ncbi:MAG: anaerobic sulfatase maturase [Desulfomonilia bacterium]|nr:anaerobic sulfatase maturase [Desulfomonilia bacterium]
MADTPVPQTFRILCRPSGPSCNFCCDYCTCPKTAHPDPQSSLKMTEIVHESFMRQVLGEHQGPLVRIIWQGGEPMLSGLDFFRRTMDLQKKYKRPGTRVEHTLKTNGLLLDDNWCGFLHENDFAVDLGMDGPQELHDNHRRDKEGSGTFDRALKAVRMLQKHRIRLGIICRVNRRNGQYPLPVYRFFRDELGAGCIRFIPLVHQTTKENPRQGDSVTGFSVRPHQWGRFLIEIFDEWVARDMGAVTVLNFDEALAVRLGKPDTACVLAPDCGKGIVLEPSGDMYSCDRFIEPGHSLGNILKTSFTDLVSSERLLRFRSDKQDMLARSCRECSYLSICNGECPGNRFMVSPHGEAGLNYLCAGYRVFFRHTEPAMELMADLLGRGEPIRGIMPVPAHQEAGSPAATFSE